MRELLLKLMEMKKAEYVEVKNGKCYRLDTGEEIPEKHLAGNDDVMLNDGYYKISKGNCGSSDCDIGLPSKMCTKLNICTPGKCAVYYLHNLGNITISYDALEKLYNGSSVIC